MKKLLLCICFLSANCLAFSQQGPSANDESFHFSHQALEEDFQSVMQNLEWRAIGPANMGGRVTDIVGLSGDPSTFYIAGADGGIFKTTNGGTTFESLFTKQRAYSVGALAIAQSDNNVLWLGSGEGDPRNSVGYGNGVYRSIDAGQSWEHLGLKETERIKRIVVHPNDPDVACVCALGKEWGPNEERGVFKTTDGGKSWSKVLYIDTDTGCSDLVMDLSNPRILYAGMWTFRRKPWRFDGGGKETAVYRSKDGGESWEKIMNGLPQQPMARIGLSIAQSSPNIVYLITEFKDAGMLFRSDDRGNSWSMVNDDPNINFRPFYYSDIRVDPNNPDVIYSLSGRLVKSTDGGKNFETIARNVHGDHQSLWIDPANSNRVLSGSDGGFQVSLDAGKSWDIINNVELSQFYQLDIDQLEPYNVYGGLQDNGCWRGPSNSLYQAGILKRHWKRLSYGDGYYAVPIPGSENEVYTNLQGGVPFHVDAATGIVRNIHPYPKIIGSAGDAIEDHKYRFNWDSPIHISPHNPDVVYFGGNVVFKSEDRGHSWTEISGDLTTNDKNKQRTSGGEIYQDNTAAEFHCSALSISESPVQEGVIWVGTDDGNLQLTKNGGQDWINVKDNISGLPENAWFGKVHASEHNAGTVFVAVDQHRSDDFTPHAFVSDDFGASWKKIVNGLPSDDYVKVIRQDPNNANVLFCGMEHGVYISWDLGDNWTRINNNLPPVSVRDLRIHPREYDLIVGTHGRGVWILDDIRPLVEWGSAKGKQLHTFPTKDSRRWHMYQQLENLGTRTYVSKNPAYGSYVNFYLGEEPEEDVEVEIQTMDGIAVRTITDSTMKMGMQRVVWDLRADGPTKMKNAPTGGWRSGDYKRLVPPGMYKAIVRANGLENEVQLTVNSDPRIEMSSEDYSNQFNATTTLHNLLSETNDMINQLDEMKDQVKAIDHRIQYLDASTKESIKSKMAENLKSIEQQRNILTRPPPAMGYRQKPQLREEILSLLYSIDGATASPTASQLERTKSLREEANIAKEQIETLINGSIKELNDQLATLPQIGIPAGRP